MSLSRLEYFVALAEELSFTRAAARLHISQPPLTHQIRRLEAELGEQLVTRTTRRVALTPAGSALLPEARRILEHYRRLPALVHEAARDRAEAFDVGCVPSAVIGLVPSLLAAVGESRPDVSLRIHELTVEEQLELLRAADLDIGIFRSREPSDGLRTFDLAPDHFCVAVPDNHPLAHRTAVAWSDLAQERFVMAGRAKAALEFDSVVGACVANGFTPKVLAEAVSGYNLVALVASGLGVAVVPERVTALTLEGATYRRLEPRVEAAPLRIAVRPERLTENVHVLVEIARRIPVPLSRGLTI